MSSVHCHRCFGLHPLPRSPSNPGSESQRATAARSRIARAPDLATSSRRQLARAPSALPPNLSSRGALATTSAPVDPVDGRRREWEQVEPSTSPQATPCDLRSAALALDVCVARTLEGYERALRRANARTIRGRCSPNDDRRPTTSNPQRGPSTPRIARSRPPFGCHAGR